VSGADSWSVPINWQWAGTVPLVVSAPRADSCAGNCVRLGGSTPGDAVKAHDILGPLADARATWWDERCSFDKLGKFDAVRARIEQGPPTIS
jgi:hypothetical protein